MSFAFVVGYVYPREVRVVSVVVLLAACKAAPAPAPIANRAGTQPATVTQAVCTISGTVYDAATHEPLAGATAVVTGTNTGEEIAITDEHGKFAIKVDHPMRRLDLYYLDSELTFVLTRCIERFAVELSQPTPSPPIVVW